MTTLYIIRHAEAEGNLYRRIHGWYDALITDNGYRQIEALRERFQTIPVDAVYSSDLFRTKTTASAIYIPKGLPLNTRRSLREINMGVWEDRTWGEAVHFDREQYDRYTACSPRWKNEGGESRAEARQRIRTAVFQIARNHPGQTVAIFAHGDIIRCLQAEVLGVPTEQMPILGHCDNTGVTCIRVDGTRAELVFKNDNSHLSEEISTLGRQRWWKEQNNVMADANAWFRPLDLSRERTLYSSLRREAWENLYGDESGYEEEGFLQEATAQAEKDCRAIWCVMVGDEMAGVLQLDLDRDRDKDVGYIQFLALKPEYRGRMLGPQLLGQAVSVYRSLNRHFLRLLCAPGNEAAQRFYVRYGFQKTATRPGRHGTLYLMEKYIGYQARPLQLEETPGLIASGREVPAW